MNEIEPWAVETSVDVVDNRWLRVREDQCRRADGHLIRDFYVLEFRPWISILALTPDGDVVVIREYHHGAGVVGAGLPGGEVGPGEEPIVAAERELREETGYACSRVVDLGSAWANWGKQTNAISYFLGLDARRVAEQRLDPNEEIAIAITPLERVREPGFLAQSYDLATLYLADRWLAQAG